MHDEQQVRSTFTMAVAEATANWEAAIAAAVTLRDATFMDIDANAQEAQSLVLSAVISINARFLEHWQEAAEAHDQATLSAHRQRERSQTGHDLTARQEQFAVEEARQVRLVQQTQIAQLGREVEHRCVTAQYHLVETLNDWQRVRLHVTAAKAS